MQVSTGHNIRLNSQFLNPNNPNLIIMSKKKQITYIHFILFATNHMMAQEVKISKKEVILSAIQGASGKPDAIWLTLPKGKNKIGDTSITERM